LTGGSALDERLRTAVASAATKLLGTTAGGVAQEAAFHIGPFGVRLQFSSAELAGELLSQFGHVIDASIGKTDLTIRATDTPDVFSGLEQTWRAIGIPPAHTSTTFRQGGTITHVEFDEDGIASMFTLDANRNIAVFAVKAASRAKMIEGTYPFLLLLRLWSEHTDHLWAHGAAVGTPRAGVLIVGMGGAGKSSTSISVTGGKLKLLSDDHVLIAPDRTASSVYSTLRIRPDMIKRLQAARPWFDDSNWFDWRGKPSQILSSDKHRFLCRQLPLKAIVIPRHHCEDGPSFHRISPAPALRAIAPVTITKHYVNPLARLELLTSIVQRLPVYEFHTTVDLIHMREPFERFIESLEG
jgi:hypothetical protein